jgi:aspartokinase/homoserine dehydrogenase 1
MLEGIKKTNIFNSVFVDCTASAAVADIYQSLLEHNVNIITANKIAASGDYEAYRKLKETAKRAGVKFRYETNVGAGLPIIGTMNDLVNSGDKILKIEAVLSGTLNYIFNALSEDVPFSETVKKAQELGFAEPDPRIDLSGKDVVRKLVILTREAGYRVEQSDVEKHLFVPDEYFEGTVEDFWKKLPQLDAAFEEKRKELAARNCRQRFVARMEVVEGAKNEDAKVKCSVSLQDIPQNHSFYELEGSNNIVTLTTSRYKEYPMLIQGFGAGASVTAAGVFANVLSIANI